MGGGWISESSFAMAIIDKRARLKKTLTLPDVFSMALGTTLGSGFFLLPGLAAEEAGPSIVLCYLIAAVPIIPLLLSVSELATAMPRAGGAYYFVDRSLGPLFGTVAGIGIWLSLILKTAFALIGMGAYMRLLFPELNILPVAVSFALFFGLINALGAKESASLQLYMVSALLAILVSFILVGTLEIEPLRFEGFFDAGGGSIMSTAGLVFISYLGVTKVASVAEEIHNPERNFPLGLMLAIGIAVLLYIGGTAVMVGVIPPEELYGALTPAAIAASKVFGGWGVWLITAAAMLAFLSVTNAGILSASRYPMAMSRDHIMPTLLRALTTLKTPLYSVVLTVSIIIASLVFLDPVRIAKLASSFQLLMVALICAAVIVMRESHIGAYDPGYRSPLYPWIQILGVVFSLLLIFEMGMQIIAATGGLIVAGALWYLYYARRNIYRSGAIYHIFARLGMGRYEELESELRGILREKGLREGDVFDMVVASADIIELNEPATYEEVVDRASALLAQRTGYSKEMLYEGFMKGTRVGATPVSHGVALPHLRLPDLDSPQMVIVRSHAGTTVEIEDEFHGPKATTKPIHAIFFLISPEKDAGQHLRIMAQIAERSDDDEFMVEWLSDKTEQDLKETLLREERFLSLTLRREGPSEAWIDREIKTLDMPEGSLIVIIHRDGELIVPRGGSVLREGDRLTIIGSTKGIRALKEKFVEVE